EVLACLATLCTAGGLALTGGKTGAARAVKASPEAGGLALRGLLCSFGRSCITSAAVKLGAVNSAFVGKEELMNIGHFRRRWAALPGAALHFGRRPGSAQAPKYPSTIAYTTKINPFLTLR
ncbi:MAG: hypothetical protein PHR82_07875, partial [Endomicrobiaceae bacterium]|nr:hypothetical protein [Endomicrobiaceae bacterium]